MFGSMIAAAAVGFVILGLAPANAGQGDAAKKPASVYDFAVKDIDGKDFKLSKYEGGVLLIVNVASKWGLTKSTYSGLESIYKKYKDKGLQIAAFPANNFGKQEPGSNETIKTFCAARMKVTFDIFAKISVAGDDQCPLYKFLTTHPDKSIAGDVPWNFQKYLIGKDGKVIAKFGPRSKPQSEEITSAIEKALAN